LQAETSGRLYGAAGDPNFLAAGLVPAMVIAAGLIAATRSWLMRSWLLVALGVVTVGLAASESRGGVIAMVTTLFVALVFFRQRRAYVLLLLLLTLGLGGAWFATTPGAWQRVTTFNDQGSGRSTIWRIAVRVAEDHPVTGAGLANFQVVSKDYVRRPGRVWGGGGGRWALRGRGRGGRRSRGAPLGARAWVAAGSDGTEGKEPFVLVAAPVERAPRASLRARVRGAVLPEGRSTTLRQDSGWRWRVGARFLRCLAALSCPRSTASAQGRTAATLARR